MSSITLLGDTSGSIVVAAPAVAGSGTLTLPTGTATLSIQGPAFSAYVNSSQTISTGTYTKIQFNAKNFDTNTCYDATTNYRFTPSVAGYYQYTVALRDASGLTNSGTIRALIYKNGSATSTFIAQNSTNGSSAITSNLIYMNGSTDYMEGYIFQNSGSNMTIAADALFNYMTGSLIRGA